MNLSSKHPIVARETVSCGICKSFVCASETSEVHSVMVFLVTCNTNKFLTPLFPPLKGSVSYE